MAKPTNQKWRHAKTQPRRALITQKRDHTECQPLRNGVTLSNNHQGTKLCQSQNT